MYKRQPLNCLEKIFTERGVCVIADIVKTRQEKTNNKLSLIHILEKALMSRLQIQNCFWKNRKKNWERIWSRLSKKADDVVLVMKI